MPHSMLPGNSNVELEAAIAEIVQPEVVGSQHSKSVQTCSSLMSTTVVPGKTNLKHPTQIKRHKATGLATAFLHKLEQLQVGAGHLHLLTNPRISHVNMACSRRLHHTSAKKITTHHAQLGDTNLETCVSHEAVARASLSSRAKKNSMTEGA